MFKFQTKRLVKPSVISLACVSLIVLAACEQKKDMQAKQHAASPVSTQNQHIFKFQSTIEDVVLQKHNCEEGALCPQVVLQRLSSNLPALDRAIDQFIQNYIGSQVDGYALDDPDSVDVSTNEGGAISQSTPVHSTISNDTMLSIQKDIDKFYRMDAESKALGSAAQFVLEIKPEVLSNAAPIVSVVVRASNYTGGAHGSGTRQYYNVDVIKHSILNLTDIILPDQRKVFNDLAYNAYQAWIKTSQPNMNLKDYQALWPFRVTDNFVLSPQGLILYYNEYDIGPYSVGQPQLLIPYHDLKGVLRSRFLPESFQSQPHHQPVHNNR